MSIVFSWPTAWLHSLVILQSTKMYKCFLLWQGHPSGWPREASRCGRFGF